MQEKIITQLQESLEAIQLTSAKSLELALQVLAWVKLSSTGELSDDLSLSTTLLDEPSRLLQVLTRLAQEGDLIGQAFANGTDFGRLDPRLLQPALTLALRLDQAGMLKSFDPVRAISSLSPKLPLTNSPHTTDSLCPSLRSSSTIVSIPCSFRYLLVWLPMYPAPPVTSTFIW